MLMDMDFCHLGEIYLTNMKELLDAVTKQDLDALKTTTRKVVHKVAEATGELIGNKIVNKIVKPKPVTDVNSKSFNKIIVPPEQREEILNELRL